jgi:formate dehydrogenase gamma subunit
MKTSETKRNAFLLLVAVEFFVIGAAACRQERITSPSVSDKENISRVCPPFFLRDEGGNVIDPIKGVNDRVPYSPKQTCGATGCHDYGKITEGYHFRQGAHELPSEAMRRRYQWVSAPGNYGGAWCSPAPLYSYLSPKHNDDPHLIDMTSFTFVTRGCGNCHPGGGPLEYDRERKRYDVWMADPASGFTPGGENNLDGDYYKARWSESGVLEADCMLCHLLSYDFETRNSQMAALNFRWAPTAAAGFARVEGSVAGNQPITVAYDRSKFHPDGRVSPHIVVSPRNETCLTCHAQPGWKKRGADFRSRTDVHLRAGMRCVDCHPAGSRAIDARLRGREVHQLGKGDDPGGHVRDDLDNTVRDCASCHSTGEFGAPIATHNGLPPLHLTRIACQSCHIPEKIVMPIQVQASDVFNTDALIPAGGKQLWAFYGVGGHYRNHYGILHMMGYDDKPTERFRPVVARYKGKIYPVNRVHTSWPGIEVSGQAGLMQPRPSDIFTMWKTHTDNRDQYSELAKITDDNGDGIIEVNRPEEIDALIAAITNHLRAIGYPLDGKRVVWVMDNRVYRSGTEYREVETELWEASPYGNVHKYNHDVSPAKAALGANGCSDCHSSGASFFTKDVLARQFDSVSAQSVWVPNHEILGIPSFAVWTGVIRESIVKPAALWIIGAVIFLLLLHAVVYGRKGSLRETDDSEVVLRFTLAQRFTHYAALSAFLVLSVTGLFFFQSHPFLNSEPMRGLHTWAGVVLSLAWIVMLLLWFRDMFFKKYDKSWLQHVGGYFGYRGLLPSGKFNAGQKLFFWTIVACGVPLTLTGAGMALLRDDPQVNLAVLYTIHDIVALFALILLVAHIYFGIILNTHSLRSIFGGRVSRTWLAEHHPQALENPQ